MPALIDLRRRIKSVRNTQQITQAMKTVSTAKFKKAQREVLQARPLWHNFPALIHRAALWSRGRAHPLLEAREEQRAIYVVITSDKGLCGAFNANLLATGLEHLEEKSRTCRIQLVLVGKKAVQFFRAKPFSVVRMLSEQPQETAREAICDLVRFLIEEYTFCRTDAVYVLYNEFKSILSPHIVLFKLLPVEFPREREDSMIPDWEPGMTDFLQAVLPEYIEVQLVHFFAESVAAEHAARMMAMDSATQNAEDLITDLTLVLNKIRQASITKELLEIMTAVEALAKK